MKVNTFSLLHVRTHVHTLCNDNAQCHVHSIAFCLSSCPTVCVRVHVYRYDIVSFLNRLRDIVLLYIVYILQPTPMTIGDVQCSMYSTMVRVETGKSAI